jgi:hypothetical protein
MSHHVPIVHKSRKAPKEEEDAAKLKFGEGLYAVLDLECI